MRKIIAMLCAAFLLTGCAARERLAIATARSMTVNYTSDFFSELTQGNRYTVEPELFEGELPELNKEYLVRVYEPGRDVISDVYKVTFIDNLPPVLTTDENWKVCFYRGFVNVNGLNVVDNYDSIEDIQMNIGGINIYEPGIYKATIFATDTSWNRTKFRQEVEVVEDMKEGIGIEYNSQLPIIRLDVEPGEALAQAIAEYNGVDENDDENSEDPRE